MYFSTAFIWTRCMASNVSVRIYLSSCCRTLTHNYLANVYVRDVFSYSHILSVNLNVNAIIIILLFSAI